MVFGKKGGGNFNPRSPYGERLRLLLLLSLLRYFNPRSPYGERRYRRMRMDNQKTFQYTIPLRGATLLNHNITPAGIISIHAPLTGSDVATDRVHFLFFDFNPRSPYGERLFIRSFLGLPTHFNPRSPYGERPDVKSLETLAIEFQSTLPLRGATCVMSF